MKIIFYDPQIPIPGIEHREIPATELRETLLCSRGDIFKNVCNKENTIADKGTTATRTNIDGLEKQNIK